MDKYELKLYTQLHWMPDRRKVYIYVTISFCRVPIRCESNETFGLKGLHVFYHSCFILKQGQSSRNS